MSKDKKLTLEEAQLTFAKQTNHRVWDLLEKENRSSEEAEEMLLAAYASLYHWSNAGTAVNLQRGYWLLTKVIIAVENTQAALEMALKCQQITEEFPQEMQDFDQAYAQELLARVYAMNGQVDLAQKHYQKAQKLGNQIQDSQDQEIFLGDLNSGNWFGLLS
jgi:tetratricopeptide (TPR) repeat protein